MVLKNTVLRSFVTLLLLDSYKVGLLKVLS